MVLGQSLGIRDWQFYDNYIKRWHLFSVFCFLELSLESSFSPVSKDIQAVSSWLAEWRKDLLLWLDSVVGVFLFYFPTFLYFRSSKHIP